MPNNFEIIISFLLSEFISPKKNKIFKFCGRNKIPHAQLNKYSVKADSNETFEKKVVQHLSFCHCLLILSKSIFRKFKLLSKSQNLNVSSVALSSLGVKLMYEISLLGSLKLYTMLSKLMTSLN